MKLLAIDTSSLACTVGVLAGEARYVRHAEREREHTKLLLPMIREVLSEAALAPAELDGIVLGNGPGSFIGMRIAASVAEGIAWGAGLRILPVSSLAAVAMRAGRPGEQVAVAQDAHVGEVYLGLYRIAADGLPTATAPERLQARAAIAALAPGTVAAGAGWVRYPDLLSLNRDRLGRVDDARYPHADELLALGARACAAGEGVSPEAVVPAYLRQDVAALPAARRP